MKSTEPTDTPDQPEVDRVVVHQAMKKFGGNAKQAWSFLKENGYWHTAYQNFSRFLRKDGKLKAVWIDRTSEYSLIEMPPELTPEKQEELQMQMQQREQEYLDAQNLESVFGDDADMVNDFAVLAETSFSKSIDVVHGLAVKDAVELHKKALWIAENVLNNEDEVERKEVSNGELVSFTGPKYTDNEKLEWFKAYLQTMGEVRKFAETSNQAGLARLQAKQIALKMNGEGERGGKSGRGGRNFKNPGGG